MPSTRYSPVLHRLQLWRRRESRRYGRWASHVPTTSFSHVLSHRHSLVFAQRFRDFVTSGTIRWNASEEFKDVWVFFA